MSVQGTVPWFLKIPAKILLSRVPLPYSAWRRLAIFRHGEMEDVTYALTLFGRHFGALAASLSPGFLEGRTVLEVGPGDTLGSALIARAFGAAQTILVDTGRFARVDVAPYRAIAAALSDAAGPSRRAARRRPESGARLAGSPDRAADFSGARAPDLSAVHTPEDLLAACRARYLTSGLASLRELPSASVDFVFSNAVLEHVRKRELQPILQELRRVLKEDGCASHEVDFRDHLGGSLHHLRFSSRVWESEFMARSGFYTNRIGCAEMVAHFRRAGFESAIVETVRWPAPPLSLRAMAPEFRDRTPEDLRVASARFVLRVLY